MQLIGPILLLLLVVGCSGEAPTLPEPPVAITAPPAAKPLPDKIPSLAVVKHFDTATSRELGVILRHDITVERITEIKEADQRARRALTRLGRQGRHVTPNAMREAREAVTALEAALDGN